MIFPQNWGVSIFDRCCTLFRGVVRTDWHQLMFLFLHHLHLTTLTIIKILQSSLPTLVTRVCCYFMICWDQVKRSPRSGAFLGMVRRFSNSLQVWPCFPTILFAWFAEILGIVTSFRYPQIANDDDKFSRSFRRNVKIQKTKQNACCYSLSFFLSCFVSQLETYVDLKVKVLMNEKEKKSAFCFSFSTKLLFKI